MILRRRLLPAVLLCLVAFVGPPPRAEDVRRPTTAESEARLKRDIFFLASDECAGRGPTGEGIKKAAEYIAAEFKKAGLKPGNPDGTYFQDFTVAGASQQGPATLVLKGPGGREVPLKEGVHFYPMGLGSAGKLTDTPLVFAGYGITNKTTTISPLYDDYGGLDVKGKVVVVLRDVPRATNRFVFPEGRFGSGFRMFGGLTRKVANAYEHGAAAVLIVNDADTARTGDDLLDFDYTAVGSGAAKVVPDPDNKGKFKSIPAHLPALHVKRDLLEQMVFNCTATELATIEADIDRDMAPCSVDLKGWTVSLEVKMKRDKLPLRNVVGVLEGKGPLANETIVVGAHYDHLGLGGGGGSLSGSKKMAIHYGADDNGSGTTAIMELARRVAARPGREGRHILFMAFSGEEIGLNGSQHYVEHPLYPLKDTTFMLNLDMVGRLRPDKDPKRDRLIAEGLGSGKGFDKLIDEWNKKYDFDLRKSDSAFGASDQFSFYEKKVPVMFLWTGDHADYHRPSDTADKINVPGMRRIVEFSEEIVSHFATAPGRPVWQELKLSGPGRPGSNGPTLGFRPEFGGEGGVGVTSVREGGPGAKAGLKAGDRILEVAGKPTANLETYAQIMGTLKAGDKIDVVVLRDDKKVTLKVTLE